MRAEKMITCSNNILLQITKYLKKWYLIKTHNSDQNFDRY